ncbi:YkgJ family cysteine cluster protein [Maribellus sediminis]|uniref:YkgJ family cysteine cluster protein n=1 Tax=Maribellus sediminis TaxID=2696285 RepID=UPI001430E735|nr:YkgJ family cysteine cluster protein [Maribellus sediminis]
MSDLFKQYKNLRDKVDIQSNKLEKQHSQHMACKMGCDLCCMDYSIFPVEFYSIREALNTKDLKLDLSSVNKPGTCVFLKNHKCTIYDERPIICRTHGLPLLFMNDEDNWELSACELNFTEFDFSDFTNENTFPQDRINSELFMTNKTFLQNFDEKEFGEFDLIPIKNLIDEIKSE